MNIEHLNDEKSSLQAILAYPNDTKDLPLLIFLHGAGERGTGSNLQNVYKHGVPKLVKEGRDIPAIVLCPQCPAMYVWNNMVREVKVLIDGIVERFGVKRDRICLTGGSMGGFGTWELAMTYPSFFSAIAPVAGGGLSWRCVKLIGMPIKAYHGTDDTEVPITYSELMLDRFKNTGADATLVRLEGFGHVDGISEAYENTDLIDWLLSKRRTDFSRVPEAFEQYF